MKKRSRKNQQYPKHIDNNHMYGDHDKYKKDSNFQLADKKYVEDFHKRQSSALDSLRIQYL